MTVDPTVLPGLLLLAAELAALTAVGYVVVRVALGQTDDRVALAQGLVVGPALWGLIANFVMYAAPGLAGAIVSWGVVMALGAVLVWRAPHPVRPQPRVAAGFVVAVLAILWIALASRQLLSIPDPGVRLGLAASIRAGGFPPELAWNPGVSAYYHYAVPLVVGLLTPPVGPDLAFVTELLGAYAWASFALVVTTLILQRSSGFAAVVTAPLLLAGGAWTFTWVGDGLLTAPVPTGLPAAGLRASLTDFYWPSIELPWGEYVWDFREHALANIWKPGFPLAYALVVVVLAHAARASDRSWGAGLTLGALVGFVGLLSTTLAPVALVLWAGLELVNLGRARHAGALPWSVVLRSGAGLTMAVCLLFGGGGRFTGFLGGTASPGLIFAWNEHRQGWRLLGELDPRPGGVGLLGVGPVALAGAAALLARRDRLVLALAIAASMLALAYIGLHYLPTPYDLGRVAGHARNFALVALLLALSARLTGLPPRWRYAASGLLVVLIVWPTIVAPLRSLGQAIGQGGDLTNAGREPREWMQGRYSLEGRLPSDRIAAYIRDHTPVDARVLTTEPPYTAVTFATGRPSAAGFVGHLHLANQVGAVYLDAIRHLEPAALRRLGIAYVHATDDWVAGLPERAAHWLADPGLFDPLVHDGGEALYGVHPAFLALDAPPAPESYEALRRAVLASTTVYWPENLESLGIIHVAGALPHTRLLTQMSGAGHFLTPWPSESLGEQTPDLVILPASIDPWVFPPAGRQPIWWNDDVAVYAPHGAVDPIMPPPNAAPTPAAPPVSVRVSDVRAADGQITFTVTIDDHAPDQWNGQDWGLIAGEESRWAIPTHLEPDRGGTPVIEQWFAGQIVPGRESTTHHYVFDAGASRLAVRESGRDTVVAASANGVGEGTWMLLLRLNRDVNRGSYVAQEEVASIPVLQIEISATGEVAGFAYDSRRGAEVLPPAQP